MKNERKRITEKMQNERGAVIVEAAIVFPVMFFVLIFIIFIGNLFYEQARIDSIVTQYAIRGAQCVADPFLDEMYQGKSVPTKASEVDLEPYRYIFGFTENSSISQVETMLSNKIKEEINNGSLIFFDGTGGKYVSTDNGKVCEFKNMFLYSTFVVQVNYEVKFPISFMNMSKPTLLRMSSRAEVPVSDTDEFVRNIDMAVDLIAETSGGKTIASIFEKVTSFINSFASK